MRARAPTTRGVPLWSRHGRYGAGMDDTGPVGELSAEEQCQACWARPWNVRFEWEYTSPEQYCTACLTDPLEGGGTSASRGAAAGMLLDFLPDCQQITHRLTKEQGQVVGRPVRYRSLVLLSSVLTSRVRPRAAGTRPRRTPIPPTPVTPAAGHSPRRRSRRARR